MVFTTHIDDRNVMIRHNIHISLLETKHITVNWNFSSCDNKK